jgi:hypothetical protein
LKFIWDPPSLEAICRSQAQLKEHWPLRWRDIQLLLTHTANALTVGELRTLRALQVTPRLPHVAGQEGGLTIRHEEIEMSTTLLTAEGRGIILQSVEDSNRLVDPVGNLRINGFTERGRSANRIAS